MCLIALAWRQHPRWPLVLAANRDEAHARPTAPASLDPDAPAVFGGRDLVQGGGWLQASVHGRLAAVTNVRVGRAAARRARSRGWLVRDFVRGRRPAEAFASGPAAGPGHGPFNALFWDGESLVHATNQPAARHAVVEAGVHAMSNGPFDAAWPKSMAATRALATWLECLAEAVDPEDALGEAKPLFDALADRREAPDELLPDTGVGLALERALSPPFVVGDAYGTRASTVVVVGTDRIVFMERRFGPGAQDLGEGFAVLPLRGTGPAA